MKIFLTLLFALSAIYSSAQEKNFIDQNYIEVVGKSEMEIVPDLIYIKIVISESDSKGKVSIAETEQKMSERLQSLGIDVKKDLSIKDLSSNFRNSFLKKTDIIISKEYQLLVRSGLMTGKVFAELEKIGVANADVNRVDHTKILEYKTEVKVAAIKAAREKAELLTKAINQGIGRAIYIVEFENVIPLRANLSSNSAVHRGYDDSQSLFKYADSDFDFEKIKLTYSVQVKFELK